MPLILALVSVEAFAQSASTRTMVIIDDSGSMRKSDPGRLSQAAAMLYMGLASPKDELGLMVFSDRAELKVPLMPSGPARYEAFRRALAMTRFSGATTNIGDALELALSALSKGAPKTQRTVLLMTDGQLDLGRRRAGLLSAELSRIQGPLTERLRQARVKVYTIAFTRRADKALMAHLAQRTQGEFRYIESARSLHEAFTELFVMASGADALPMEGDGFMMDRSIGSASLVLSKSSTTPNTVTTPDDVTVDPEHPHPQVRWTSTPSYDLVELERPEPGSWRVEQTEGQSATAVIKESSLKLEVSLRTERPMFEELVILEAYLLKNDKPETSFSALKLATFTAQIEDPLRKSRTIELKQEEPGRFIARIKSESAGYHAVTVTALSPHFRRVRKVSYAVLKPCFSHEVQGKDQDGLHLLALRLTTACPRYLAFSARLKREIKHQGSFIQNLERSDPHLYVARFEALEPGYHGRYEIEIDGSRADGEPGAFTLGPYELPEKRVGALYWVLLVGRRLLVINVPIAIVLGALAHRRRRQRLYGVKESKDD